MNSPVARSRQELEAAAMPPFTARNTRRIRGSRAAYSDNTGRTCDAVEQSSAMHNSQLGCVWAKTDSMLGRSHFSGVSNTGINTEILGDVEGGSCASAARALEPGTVLPQDRTARQILACADNIPPPVYCSVRQIRLERMERTARDRSRTCAF